MTTLFKPMLHLLAETNFDDIIFVVIFLVITVGGWIVQAIRKMQQKNSAETADKAATPTSKGQRLEELAAKRRQQLQELARQRQAARARAPGAPARAPGTPGGTGASRGAAASAESGGGGGGESGGGGQRQAEPGNLTMAERIARARTRSQYEARAATLPRYREKQSAASAQEDQTQRNTQAQQEQERRRAEALGASRRQRTQIEDRRRHVGAPQLRPPVPQPPTRVAPPSKLGQGVQNVQKGHDAPTSTGESVVHRHVPDAGGARQPHPVGAVRPNRAVMTNRAALRQAIVLKEILGAPVGLRDAASQFIA